MSAPPGAPDPRATRSTYAGLLGVTLATLMLQILLTRIFSVTLWYHFAFMAVSIAMFGLTLGATIVYLRPRSFPADGVKSQLAVHTLAFAISIVVCFVAHLYVPLLTGTGSIAAESRAGGTGSFASTAAYLGLTFAVVTVPFVFSGIAVCLALTRFPPQLGRLYAADLSGAALGCLLLVALLGVLDAPAAVFAVAACAGVAAWLFARDAPAPAAGRLSLRTLALLLTLWLGAGTIYLAVRAGEGSPALRLIWLKGVHEAPPLFEKWNSFAYLRVFQATETPFGWGFSQRAVGRPLRQLGVTIDANAATVMTEFDGDLEPLVHLEWDVTNLAHHLRRDARVLVVGAGGGRDVLSALRFGQRSVTAVEINGDLLETLNGRFGSFSGHLDRRPDVRFVNDEARSFVARSPELWDVLQISMIDTWAATAAGAYVLTENSLYTVEAWRGFLEKLTPTGLLSVSRWHDPEQPAETHRLAALAVRTLLEAGVARARDHVVLVTNLSAGDGRQFGVATLLVSPSPFSARDLDRLRTAVATLGFQVLVSPDGAADPVLDRITNGVDLDAVVADHPFDISPPTDDRPFFFHMLRLRDALGAPRGSPTVTEFNLRAVRVLGALLLIVVASTAAFLLLPLVLRASLPPRGALAWLVYFGAIGLGFMFVEISQIQRLSIFLGHPTYGLSVLLFSLLLSSGLGSLFVPRIESAAHARAAAWRLAALLGVLGIFGWLTPAAIESFRGSATTVRVAVAVGILFPLGLVLGTAFPLGMGAAALRHRALTPWFWGINGATSVCASVAAVAIALSVGISAALWVGALCYALAALAFAAALSGR